MIDFPTKIIAKILFFRDELFRGEVRIKMKLVLKELLERHLEWLEWERRINQERSREIVSERRLRAQERDEVERNEVESKENIHNLILIRNSLMAQLRIARVSNIVRDRRRSRDEYKMRRMEERLKKIGERTGRQG